MPTDDDFPFTILHSITLFFLPLPLTLIVAYIFSTFMILISICIRIFIQLNMPMKETRRTTRRSRRSCKRFNWQKFDKIDWQTVESYSRICYCVLSVILFLLCCVNSILLSPIIIAFVSHVDNASAALLEELVKVEKRAADKDNVAKYELVWIEEEESEDEYATVSKF